MNRHYTRALLICLFAVLAAGCEQTSIASQEEIRSFETVQALTPTITPTFTPSPTATATPIPPTLTPTEGPSPTPLPPTATTIPSPTPLPPTATPNPALRDFSLCTQVAGESAGGRFSARVIGITTTIEPALERVVIALDVPGDSAAPYASARCTSSGSAYEIAVDLDGWLRDEAFRTSTTTVTQVLSGTKILSRIELRAQPDAPAGASLVLPLNEPHTFRLALETKPYRLVLEVATAPALGAGSDMLTLPTQSGGAPDDPIFYLQGGDIWRYRDGQPENLTDSPEIETSLSASSAGGRIAFCRAVSAPGDVAEVSSLWVMEFDGSNQLELAAPGRSCAEPAFSPDGTTIAFAVDEDASGAQPARLSIWTIDLTSGQGPQRITNQSDEWSRFGPQWLGNQKLIYTAQAEDGRSTLFLRDDQKREIDIGASLLVAEGPQGQSVARYAGFGRPLAAPDGKTFAVEALRIDRPGADLLLLDTNGNEQGAPANDAYWSRPAAFGPDGTLYALTSVCASDAAQSYVLFAQPRSGQARTLAIGQTAGGFGQIVALDGGLGYVTLAAPGASGPRGPLNLNGAGASALWFWDLSSGGRARLVESPEPILGLAR